MSFLYLIFDTGKIKFFCGWLYCRPFLGLGLWCLMPLSTIFQTLSHNVASSTPLHEEGSNSQL